MNETCKKILRGIAYFALFLFCVAYLTGNGGCDRSDDDRGGVAAVESGLGGAGDSVAAAEDGVSAAGEHVDRAAGAIDDAAKTAGELQDGAEQSANIIDRIADILGRGESAIKDGAKILDRVGARYGGHAEGHGDSAPPA